MTIAPTWTPRSDAWLARAPSEHAGTPNRPLFIGGCPRSGTTLLRVMLDTHPALGLPHETNFVRPLYWQRRAFGDLTDRENRRRAAHFIFKTRGTRDNRIRQGVSQQEAIEIVASAPPTIGSLVAAAFKLYAGDKPRWGDKRPAYSGFVGPLFAMFPDAQYINLVRDPRGTVASGLTMGWDEPEVAVASGAARWLGAIERTDHVAEKLRPDQLLDVRYEDLAAEPHAALERIFAWAGLDPEPIDAIVAAESRDAMRGPHTNVAQDVSTRSVERWRQRLSDAEAALVEHAAAPYLSRFGYAPAGLDAAPSDIPEFERRRAANRKEWRRSRRNEFLTKLRYRSDVANRG